MKRFIINISFLALLSLMINIVAAQDTTQHQKPSKASIIENEIKNKDFNFIANWVVPLRGMIRQLTDYYNLKITNDSVVAYLPYFGRAYTAPLDPTNVSIHISSTLLEYSVTKRKKGGWDILIKPKDQTDIQSFSLSVFNNGTAYLNIISANRDAISYNGYLEEKK